MSNPNHPHWFTPWLAVAFTMLGMSYVFASLVFPYDGSRLEPGKQYWLKIGALVNPLRPMPDGLKAGDLVIAVEDKSMNELGESLVRFDFIGDDPLPANGLSYSIIRDRDSLEILSPNTRFPIEVLLNRYWSIYLVIFTMMILMTYVLIRRPMEAAAEVLFIFAWSLWNTPAWMMGLQVNGIFNGWGFWHYHLVTNVLFLTTFAALLHTSLVFPKRSPLLDRIPHLVPSIYTAPFIIFVLGMAIARFFSSNTWIWLGHWNSIEWAVGTLYMLLFIVITIQNFRHATDQATRLKIRWVAFGWGVAGIGIVFLWLLPGAVLGQPLIPTTAMALILLPLPVAMALAILRYQLFDIDIVINRTLVYGTLTLMIILVYVVVVGYVGTLFHTQSSDHSRKDILLSLAAAGMIAVIIQPLRERLQQTVNRFMYGERDDPYSVLTRLGQKLEAAGSVETVLPTIVETIGQALKLPYVAIIFNDEKGTRLAATYGLPKPFREIKYPLIHQNESFGELVLAQRSEAEYFTPKEERLLADLAREVEVAAHNVQLTADLKRSRQELVTRGEEERRRIRRDLHDEIGPLLASQSLTLEAIEKLIGQDPAAAAALARDLKEQTQDAVYEIRRIIHDLRPPTLDDLGLVEALRERFAHLSASKPSVKLDTDGDLPVLNAALETAVYRIAVEAVTNVLRHAEANECLVRLYVNGDLNLEISDDGKGLPSRHRSGVGLRAMTERAEELGGRLLIESPPGKGTRLLVTIPVPGSAR